jgi:membrane protease YdiL (CAAX protease family)
LAGIYFIYLVCSFFTLRAKHRKGEAIGRGIPEKIKPMFPVSQQEKRAWAVTSVLVGVAEELMFRGFIIYLLITLFPALPLAVVLVASAVLFGAGHLYQGPAEAVKPALIGLLFGLFYVSFGTIWPCVALHALQDLCSVYAL